MQLSKPLSYIYFFNFTEANSQAKIKENLLPIQSAMHGIIIYPIRVPIHKMDFIKSIIFMPLSHIRGGEKLNTRLSYFFNIYY
jgi:hypothetical protein